ncbi:hypothetical protein CEB3_c22990 [Peptococcaceae bacterium CEB3]|nr:hypothetical protein CEB3_c22990 [Peptococcaceae bacterium CEB3]
MSFKEQFGQTVTRFFSWSWNEHPGKLVGTSSGFVFGLFLVILGFWRALVLSLFIVAGFLLGKRYDEHRDLTAWLNRFFQK